MNWEKAPPWDGYSLVRTMARSLCGSLSRGLSNLLLRLSPWTGQHVASRLLAGFQSLLSLLVGAFLQCTNYVTIRPLSKVFHMLSGYMTI